MSRNEEVANPRLDEPDEPEAILDAWIMYEHLAEGDIDPNDPKDKKLRTFKDLRDNDYYTLFNTEFNQNNKSDKKDDYIILYLGIYDFSHVIKLICKCYKDKGYEYRGPDEDAGESGSRFAASLILTRDLSLADTKDLFYTASGYILEHKGEVPTPKDLSTSEANLAKTVSDALADLHKDGAIDQDGFNGFISRLVERFGGTCRMATFNRKSDDRSQNFHSFFVSELRTARSSLSPGRNTGRGMGSLRLYLSGRPGGERVDLNGNKNLTGFNPDALSEILKPANFPLGRFPSDPDRALSLMQQAAVNLACSPDVPEILSVNGPPGTGKTTLLRDVFADLVVEQARIMAELTDKHMKPDGIFQSKTELAKLPDPIAQLGIVVASSNNGAVENIVRELPLEESISSDILEELEAVDYFRDLPNEQKRESDKSSWGAFSMQGGRTSYMSVLLTHVESMADYLENPAGRFEPDAGVYQKFLMRYNQVQSMRAEAQEAAKHLRQANQYKDRLAQLDRERLSEPELKKLEDELSTATREVELLEQRINELNEKVGTTDELILANARSKPCIFRFKKRREHEETNRELQQERLQRIKEVQAVEDELASKRTNEGRLRKIIEDDAKLINEISDCETEIDRKLSAWNAYAGEHKEEPHWGGALDFGKPYDELQKSSPWFGSAYREAQSRLFVSALAVRKQFLYDNRESLKAAVDVLRDKPRYRPTESEQRLIGQAFAWVNLAVPVIGSTFASIRTMCRGLGPGSIGYLFIDEAGQAMPQAAVGAVARARRVVAVGDPAQIKPVMTMGGDGLGVLATRFHVTQRFLSDKASVQTLADTAGTYGFYKSDDQSEGSWIGVPLWVHRRCLSPIFDISNDISYGGQMVQAMGGEQGEAVWYDVRGQAEDKYVEEQGDFVADMIASMAPDDWPNVYVISPFRNVARRLAERLHKIGFTIYKSGKPTNVGTVHTFQGKQAKTVFLVLGADKDSQGAARWAVGEPNIVNVAVSRAKERLYIVGDHELYCGLKSPVVDAVLKHTVLKRIDRVEPADERRPV